MSIKHHRKTYFGKSPKQSVPPKTKKRMKKTNNDINQIWSVCIDWPFKKYPGGKLRRVGRKIHQNNTQYSCQSRVVTRIRTVDGGYKAAKKLCRKLHDATGFACCVIMGDVRQGHIHRSSYCLTTDYRKAAETEKLIERGVPVLKLVDEMVSQKS